MTKLIAVLCTVIEKQCKSKHRQMNESSHKCALTEFEGNAIKCWSLASSAANEFCTNHFAEIVSNYARSELVLFIKSLWLSICSRFI